MKKALKRIFIILLAVYFWFGIYIFFFQSKYIYFPDNQDFSKCSAFNTAQKLNLNGTRAYYKKNSDKLVVFYHGNAGSACDRAFLKNEFEKLRYSYIIVEYAGYSNDSRNPSKELILQDARNVNDFLSTLEYSHLVLAGESIGGSVALYHSTIAKEDKVLLLSPFDDILNIARKNYPIYPIKLLLKERYDNKEWIGDLSNIMIIHGQDDKIIPIEESKKLFEKINIKDKKFIEIDGAGHNDLFNFSDTYSWIYTYLIGSN